VIIAKSYNRALKCFVGGFLANRAAVIGRKHDEILNLWMRSPVKFIKFLRKLEMKFVSGALSIKFHYKIFQYRFLKFLLRIQPPLSIALV